MSAPTCTKSPPSHHGKCRAAIPLRALHGTQGKGFDGLGGGAQHAAVLTAGAFMSFLRITPLALALSFALHAMPVTAQSDASEASALSLLPVAVSVAAPALLLSAGVTLTVVAVEASATGTVWVVERASDGARASLRFTSQVAQSTLVGVGSAVTVSVVGAGVVLSVAGQAIAFVPNAVGRALSYHEPLSR
jgi:hypothetical protein